MKRDKNDDLWQKFWILTEAIYTERVSSTLDLSPWKTTRDLNNFYFYEIWEADIQLKGFCDLYSKVKNYEGEKTLKLQRQKYS